MLPIAMQVLSDNKLYENLVPADDANYSKIQVAVALHVTIMLVHIEII